jgi:hypothetical protein
MILDQDEVLAYEAEFEEAKKMVNKWRWEEGTIYNPWPFGYKLGKYLSTINYTRWLLSMLWYGRKGLSVHGETMAWRSHGYPARVEITYGPWLRDKMVSVKGVRALQNSLIGDNKLKITGVRNLLDHMQWDNMIIGKMPWDVTPPDSVNSRNTRRNEVRDWMLQKNWVKNVDYPARRVRTFGMSTLSYMANPDFVRLKLGAITSFERRKWNNVKYDKYDEAAKWNW